MAMEAHVRAGILLDYYGALLTPRQRTILALYFEQDLSLAEIAQQEGITRQGVHDMIRRGEKQMELWESQLGLLAQAQARRARIAKIREMMQALQLSPLQAKQQQELLQLLNEEAEMPQQAEGEIHGI